MRNKRFISLFLALLLMAALAPATIFAASSGTTWSSSTSGTGDILAVTFGNGTYVAVTADGKILKSTNGTSWTASTYNSKAYLNTVSFGGGKFNAFGTLYDGNNEPVENLFLTSSDGTTWDKGTLVDTVLYLNADMYINEVKYGSSNFVAVGAEGLIMISNPTNWNQIQPNSAANNSQELNGVAYGSNTYVAVGDHGTILTSSDNGANWISRTSGISTNILSVSYGGSTFVAVGSSGVILTSTNGISWTPRTSGIASSLLNVSYGNGGFVAVGASGVILTSNDGTTWSTRSSGTTKFLYEVSYGTSSFVVVGEAGTILKSALGVIYNGNNKTTGSVPVDNTAYANGATATVLGNTGSLVKTGFTFAGWNTAADGSGTDKAAGSTVTIGDSDTTLYAKWTAGTSPTPTPTTGATPTPTPTTGATPTPTPSSGPVTAISLDATKYSLATGGTHTTVVYSNKNDNSSTVIAASDVTFASSSTAVATVDASGVVTGVGKGTATISATYTSGNATRYVTVTVDPKAPAYLLADNVKAGAVTLSILDTAGAAVENAAVKISAGTQVYPLLKTDNKGKITAYVPTGAYSLLVYSLNGTTLKNYSFKSLKVVAGQGSAPLVQPQFTAGSIDLALDTIKGADKKISGTTAAGATVTARDGATIIGTAKADVKLGKFSIALKAAQPGKTIAVTAVDIDENEKTASVEVPMVTPVVLAAATKDNDVDHDIAILFKDTVGLLVNSVTSVTYNGTALTKPADYTLVAGKLTIKAGVIQAAGSHTIVVKSSAYEDATVTQPVKAGAPDATKTAYSLSGTLAAGQTATATVIVKDIYGNLAAGKQVYADITYTNTTKTTAEKYTVGTGIVSAAAKGKLVGLVTDPNGATTIAVVIPATVDTGDGISIQLKVGATAAKATAFGDPITFTK